MKNSEKGIADLLILGVLLIMSGSLITGVVTLEPNGKPVLHKEKLEPIEAVYKTND